MLYLFFTCTGKYFVFDWISRVLVSQCYSISNMSLFSRSWDVRNILFFLSSMFLIQTVPVLVWNQQPMMKPTVSLTVFHSIFVLFLSFCKSMLTGAHWFWFLKWIFFLKLVAFLKADVFVNCDRGLFQSQNIPCHLQFPDFATQSGWHTLPGPSYIQQRMIYVEMNPFRKPRMDPSSLEAHTLTVHREMRPSEDVACV